MTMNSVTEAIEAFAQGEIVIVTDDDDRENEGDLIVAASLCTPEKMAFIIRNTCGIVCAPVTLSEARRLHLDPMVAANDAPLGTAFTVTVDVKHGLTTGISAEQRCNTVRALANGNMGANDFVRPGHVFPLIARDGGVLMRSGHTEAAVDLCRLAKLPPVGVICELANDDGTVMKGPQITEFAERHALKRVETSQKQENLADGEGRGTGRLLLVLKPMPKRVTADWMAQQWRDGKRTKKKIGSYPSMSLAQARAAGPVSTRPKLSSSAR